MSLYLFTILPKHLHSHLLLHYAQTNSAKAKESASQRTTTDPMNRRLINKQEGRTANSGFALWGLTCFVETFVQGSTFLLRINISAKNPPQRKAANRYR